MREPTRLDTDVLVVGCGMAGMTCAARAAAAGHRVIAIDSAPRTGGSAVLSGGHLWTAPTYELLREHCPDGDPELGRVLVDRFPETVEFVRRTGATFSDELAVLYGRGFRFDVLGYFARVTRAVEAAGGWVLPGRVTERLITTDGRVRGAWVRDVDGPTEVRADHVVLATGGFQGNSALMYQYLGPRSRHLLLRSNPYSSGDALRLAGAVGAATGGTMDAFYGHLIAWPPFEFKEKDFARLSLLFSAYGVLLDVSGRRFTDESLGDHVSVQRVAEQASGRAVLVFDDVVRRERAAKPNVAGLEHVDRFREAELAGARVATAPTVAALSSRVASWGYAEAGVRAGVEQYNDQLDRDHDLDGGGGAAPGVPRRWNRDPVATAPFYAMEVKPAITFTEGGLGVDTHARVLDTAGEAIPGLFAAGADVGGVFNGGYAGGLALAAVFASVAADSFGRPS